MLLEDHFKIEQRTKFHKRIFKSKMSFQNCDLALNRCSILIAIRLGGGNIFKKWKMLNCGGAVIFRSNFSGWAMTSMSWGLSEIRSSWGSEFGGRSSGVGVRGSEFGGRNSGVGVRGSEFGCRRWGGWMWEMVGNRRWEVESLQLRGRGRNLTVRGWRSEVDGRRLGVRGRKLKVRDRRVELKNRRFEKIWCKKSEDQFLWRCSSFILA